MIMYKYNGRTVYRIHTPGGYIETIDVRVARRFAKQYNYLTQVQAGFLPAHLRKQGNA